MQEYSNGKIGAVLIVIALILTTMLGFVGNITDETETKVKYNMMTDVTSLYESQQVYDEVDYNPTANWTGWQDGDVVAKNNPPSQYIYTPAGNQTFQGEPVTANKDVKWSKYDHVKVEMGDRIRYIEYGEFYYGYNNTTYGVSNYFTGTKDDYDNGFQQIYQVKLNTLTIFDSKNDNVKILNNESNPTLIVPENFKTTEKRNGTPSGNVDGVTITVTLLKRNGSTTIPMPNYYTYNKQTNFVYAYNDRGEMLWNDSLDNMIWICGGTTFSVNNTKLDSVDKNAYALSDKLLWSYTVYQEAKYMQISYGVGMGDNLTDDDMTSAIDIATLTPAESPLFGTSYSDLSRGDIIKIDANGLSNINSSLNPYCRYKDDALYLTLPNNLPDINRPYSIVSFFDKNGKFNYYNIMSDENFTMNQIKTEIDMSEWELPWYVDVGSEVEFIATVDYMVPEDDAEVTFSDFNGSIGLECTERKISGKISQSGTFTFRAHSVGNELTITVIAVDKNYTPANTTYVTTLKASLSDEALYSGNGYQTTAIKMLYTFEDATSNDYGKYFIFNDGVNDIYKLTYDVNGIKISTNVDNFTNSYNLGIWKSCIVNYNTSDGTVTITPIKNFSNFRVYETFKDSDGKDYVYETQADVSEWQKDGETHKWLKEIQIIGNKFSTTKDGTNIYQTGRFGIIGTTVIEDTYGVLMKNPKLELWKYFPETIKNGLRLEFSNIAKAGNTISLGGTVYTISSSDKVIFTDGKEYNLQDITVDYTYNSKDDTYTTYVSFDGTHTSTISKEPMPVVCTGTWYFATTVYTIETYTDSALKFDVSHWDKAMNTQMYCLIFMGILVVLVLLWETTRGGLGMYDLLFVGGAIIVGLILSTAQLNGL